tara:strand:+ start:743 stop:943 length:201 start_codon:yes stop_codon:yes gene_type:complete
MVETNILEDGLREIVQKLHDGFRILENLDLISCEIFVSSSDIVFNKLLPFSVHLGLLFDLFRGVFL